MRSFLSKTLVVLAMTVFAAGCAETTYNYDNPSDRDKIFGKDAPGIFDEALNRNLFGGDGDGGGAGGGIGVNVFLWRASLDTFGFIPLASADPFGGLIITDWYNPPNKPFERLKVTVYILDKRLRADAIKVTVFRQTRPTGGGEWQNAPVAEDTGLKLEDAVLTRARELRIKSQQAQQ